MFSNPQSGSAGAAVLRAFSQMLSLGPEECVLIGTQACPIPAFPESLLDTLCDEAIATLKTESHLINVPLPCVVVGDLHGNLPDLIRVWTSQPAPYERHFLFLGDFVDRGEFSLEVISLVLALKIQYPDQIHLIRGNHEFMDINLKYGFYDEIMSIYSSDKLWRKLNTVFSYLPLCGIIGNSWFCVHGGISADLKVVSQVLTIPFPLEQMTPGIVTNLVWSDPSSDIKRFVQNPRGVGCAFGLVAADRFLFTNGLQKMIRAHEQQMDGIEVLGNVTTVFSTSGYSNDNCGAFLDVTTERTYDVHQYKPIPFKQRIHSVFRMFREQSTSRTIRAFLSANIVPPAPLLAMRTTSKSAALFSRVSERKRRATTTFL